MKKSFIISTIFWLAAASQLWLTPAENAHTDLRFEQHHLSFYQKEEVPKLLKVDPSAESTALFCDETPLRSYHLASSDSLRQF